jgi:hypothetical protein
VAERELRAPFQYFGGKRDVVELVWARLGAPKQYLEPFCGSAAMLLGAPEPASLEVVNDINGFIANFWRAVKHQPAEVARWCDYPVSHIDLGARHVWLLKQRERVGAALQDANWVGDAQVAGWWLWGQCAWIGSGWCDWTRPEREASPANGQVPQTGNAGVGVQAIGQIRQADTGRGIQALGRIPHQSGAGVQAIGKIPHAFDAGHGIQAIGKIPEGDVGDDMLTSTGRTAWQWLHRLAARLERVRVNHGAWERSLNHNYGGGATAVFLDPPYRAYEEVYGCVGCADAVETWAAEHAHLRVALCGHHGDYPSLDGWDVVQWTRKRLTYGGSQTTDKEAIWFSPACLKPVDRRQLELFA